MEHFVHDHQNNQRKHPDLHVITTKSVLKSPNKSVFEPIVLNQRSQSESPRKKFFSEIPRTSYLKEKDIPTPKKKLWGGIFTKKTSKRDSETYEDESRSASSQSETSMTTDASDYPESIDSKKEKVEKKSFWKK